MSLKKQDRSPTLQLQSSLIDNKIHGMMTEIIKKSLLELKTFSRRSKSQYKNKSQIDPFLDKQEKSKQRESTKAGSSSLQLGEFIVT